MKKLTSLLLAFAICLGMSACMSDDKAEDKKDKKDKVKTEETKKEEAPENTEASEEYNAAVALLDEGKVKEAYIALYAIRETDAHATALMEKFVVVPSRLENEYEHEYKYTYSDKGLKTRESCYIGGEFDYLCDYQYDNEGRCIKETATLDGQGSKFYTYYEYDSNGLLAKVINEHGAVKSETTYTYKFDANGDKAERVMSDSDGVEYVTKYEYSDDGLLVKEEFYNEGAVLSVISYEYDGEGRCIKLTDKGRSTEIIVETVYNIEGKKAIEKRYYDGELDSETVYYYSTTHGELTSTEKKYPDGKKKKCEDYSGFEFYYVG